MLKTASNRPIVNDILKQLKKYQKDYELKINCLEKILQPFRQQFNLKTRKNEENNLNEEDQKLEQEIDQTFRLIANKTSLNAMRKALTIDEKQLIEAEITYIKNQQKQLKALLTEINAFEDQVGVTVK